ncbi:hypothetical protein FHS76_002001 [Ochrobactrum daejeonense]|uniref:Uncharacterized protein n=1 Tax=Brucella daejeonensis TaxID=659015 RepID=A0A7W9AXA5_9HYPH|nr:hypothetical protein [Brucella daejeonensis]MBB5702126.1 hypothetical protein [Brucella daejeonensis]
MASHTNYASYRYPMHTLSKGYGDPLLWLSKQGEGEGEGEGKAEGEREEQKKEKEKSKREIAKKPCLKSGHGNARDMRLLALERVTIRNASALSGDAA